LPVDDVGESTFEAAQRLFRGLALQAFALVVATAGRVRLADLRHGHHVQRVVESPVAGPGESVPDLLAGGGVRGAVVGGEVVPAGEAGEVLDLGQDPSSDQRPDAVKIDQVCDAPLDQPGDLLPDGLHLRQREHCVLLRVGGEDIAVVTSEVVSARSPERLVVTFQSRSTSPRRRLGLITAVLIVVRGRV
jgi:hypothetical protein